MTYDYFTPGEAEQYAFYRIPKILITGEQFRTLSMEAKLLYGILLDRVSLSLKNGWVDENNHIYIIFTIEDIMEEMNCSNKKAVSMLAELEKKAALVEKKRQGLGRPNLIYVKNFFTERTAECELIRPDGRAAVENFPPKPADHPEMSKVHSQKCKNDTSGNVAFTSAEVKKLHGNNTDINKTENSDTDLIGSYPEMGCDAKTAAYSVYRNYFRNALEIENLVHDEPAERDTIYGLLELLTETCATTKKTIRISGEEKPADVVRSRLMKLNIEHIRYVLHCLSVNTTEVRNMKQYILASLYNAPATISPYYNAWVNRDMASGII